MTSVNSVKVSLPSTAVCTNSVVAIWVVFNDTPSIGNVGNIDNNKHLATRGFVTDQVSTKANTAGPTLTGTTTIRGSFNITGNDTPTFRSATFNSPVVFNGPVTGIVSSEVGLGNVTNESKATMFTSAALTGTPTAPTASASTNTTQVATTAFVKGEIDLTNTLVSLSDTAINSPALGSALRHGHTIVYDSPSGKFVSDSPGELHLNTFNSPKHLANTVGAINAIRSDVNLKSNSNSPTFLGATFNSKVTFNSPVELGGKVRFSSSSPASITVSGAGTTSVNGTYPLYTGSLSHLNPKGNTLVYNKGGFYLYQLNSNSQWRIDTDASEDNGYYTNTATTDNPPISGWTSANEGDDPAPTLFSPSSVSFSDTPSVGAEGNLDTNKHIATRGFVIDQVATENTVAEMNDVTITNLRSGQVLVYDSPTGKYINQTLTEAGITASGLSLGSVVNQSPRANAISLLTQQALDLKSNSSSPTFLGGQFNSTVVFNSPVGFKGDITFNSPITLSIFALSLSLLKLSNFFFIE